MILSAIFVFTLVVTILNVFKLVSIIAGNSIDYAGTKMQKPTHFIWFYPSVLYQAWYWSTYFNLIGTTV